MHQGAKLVAFPDVKDFDSRFSSTIVDFARPTDRLPADGRTPENFAILFAGTTRVQL